MSKIYWVHYRNTRDKTIYKRQFLSKERQDNFIKECKQKNWQIIKMDISYV